MSTCETCVLKEGGKLGFTWLRGKAECFCVRISSSDVESRIRLKIKVDLRRSQAISRMRPTEIEGKRGNLKDHGGLFSED